MKLEIIKLDELIPLEKNVRKHNEKQIEELIRSLNQFGQTRAIIVDEKNNVLIGNGLLMAMKQRGDETAECSRVIGLSEKQKKKLVLSDNKVFSLGMDDYSIIQEFIDEITFDGDFDIAGFDDDVLKSMTRSMAEVEADIADYGKIPQEYVKPNTEVAPNNQTSNETHSRVETYNPQPVPQMSTEMKVERTIVCPSCGEVIHID